jgi:hypothetical protein
MENIPADVIRQASLELSPRDVLSLCLSKKSFSKAICNSDVFWRNKIKVDYPKQTYSLKFYQTNPKKLYMMLTMNSKIIELGEDEFSELKNMQNYSGDDIASFEIMAENMSKYINKEFIDENFLKRGDVLHLGWGSTYRNDDKFLWDGEKVVLLDYEDDEYGSVPKEFSFPEFRPEYFSESIDHNNIVRLTPEKIKEVVDNFNVETQISYVTDRYNKYPVEINTDISNVDIKFNKIFFNRSDYLDYDKYDKVFNFNVDTLGTGGGGSNKKFITIVRFYPEWKEAIIDIIPNSPNTTYTWNGDVLEVITLR